MRMAVVAVPRLPVTMVQGTPLLHRMHSTQNVHRQAITLGTSLLLSNSADEQYPQGGMPALLVGERDDFGYLFESLRTGAPVTDVLQF